MAAEPMNGLMEGNLWEIGKIIKWMAMVNFNGLMEENIKATILMISN
jgi:hypothetical protein